MAATTPGDGKVSGRGLARRGPPEPPKEEGRHLHWCDLFDRVIGHVLLHPYPSRRRIVEHRQVSEYPTSRRLGDMDRKLKVAVIPFDALQRPLDLGFRAFEPLQ